MREQCNVNGRITPLAEATVHVMDRGFLFGDSIYEVFRTHRGVPFAFPEHLQRLRASANRLALPLQLDDAQIMKRVKATLAAAGGPPADGDAYVRIIVTRGIGLAPSIDLRTAPGPSGWVILVRPAPPRPAPPAHLAIIDRLRLDRRALDPAIKSGNYLNSVLGLSEAQSRGADDCLFLNANGHVTEGSTSNFFAVRDGRVFTPPLDAGILAGITRQMVLDLCGAEGVECVEQPLTTDDVCGSDELFLTSTMRDVCPIVKLNGTAHRGGEPGPLTRQLAAAFDRQADALVSERYGPAWRAVPVE